MAESPKNCPACDAVIRPKAVFCHLCGRALSLDNCDAPVMETQNLSTDVFADDFVSASAPENETVLAKTPTVVERTPPIEIRAVETETVESKQTEIAAETLNGAAPITLIAEPTTNFPNDLPDEPENTKNSVVTAAKETNPVRRKTYVSRTEYVWEEASAPTWRIILFSLIALVAVGMLLWLNNYLR